MTLLPRIRLESAFRNTCYRVYLPQVVADIHVGSTNADLDQWLSKSGALSWAFVTACNPRAIALSVEENRLRHRDLQQRVQQLGWPVVAAEAIAQRADWLTEHGLLIAGIPYHDALRLAHAFDQYAIVAGKRGLPAQLLWIDEDLPH